jgi:hypothetical protein
MDSSSFLGTPVYRQKFFLAVQHSCLSLKITLGLAPSCNFLATNTRVSGLLEKISGNISVPWYIIQGGPDITYQKNSGSLEGHNKSKKNLFVRSKIMRIN